MLGKRRPKSNTVFSLSLILGILMAGVAAYFYLAGKWLWLAVFAALSVWFFVDAVRAFGWMRAQKAEEAAQAKQGQGEQVR